ncbi:MAG: hypothetical protein GY862_20865 [Gammaproteobacteria bacterium]|nr:hypothetical protein [Gammaproteobacteria bacterium]
MEISTRNRTELKSYFVKNSIPTESNFAELIDGMLNPKDDGIVKLPDNPLCIEAAGDGGSSKNALSFYRKFSSEEPKPDWIFNLNPRSDPNDSNTVKSGFNISDGEGNSRLFIDKKTGNIGIGTTEPAAKLDIRLAVRSGSHPSSLKGLYITGDFGEDNDGIEFRKSDGTQGIGFGYNTIYATGTDANQSLFLKAQGTGQVKVDGILRVAGKLHADKYVVQNGIDGGSVKGIRMWTAGSSDWGIYMGTSGDDKSLAGNTAVEGQGFSGHAIRLRTNRYSHQGLIYENGNEELNFSVRASDGLTYIRGNLGIGKAPACKLDVDGAIQATGGLRVDGAVKISSDISGEREILLESPADGQHRITPAENEDSFKTGLVYRVRNNPPDSAPIFQIRSSGEAVRFFVDHEGWTGSRDNAAWFGGSADSYFAGNMGIGSINSAGAKLHVANYALENAAFQPLLKLTAYQSDENADNAFDESKPSYGLEFHRKWHTGDQYLQAGIYAWGTAGWGSGLAFRTALNHSSLNTQMVITNQGNIGIGTTNPNTKLEVNGAIRATGGLYVGTNGTTLQCIIVGNVNSSGERVTGSGFTSTRESTGTYIITFTTAFATTPIIVATCNNVDDNTITATASTTGSTITICDVDPDENATREDGTFSFIAIGVA